MGRRLLIVVIALSTTLVSQFSVALGLGKINLQSNLNEPLQAEIELLQAKDLSESEILVGLATNEDFQRVGVDKPFFLSDLRFKVVLDGNGGGSIQVSSRKTVREPFLNFIVQVQWPSGRLLREYTLLMDLPVYAGDTAQPITPAPVQQQPASTVQPAPKATVDNSGSRYNPRSAYTPPGGQSARPSGVSSSQPLQPRATAGDEVFVNANDTLWEIASSVRPNRSVTVQQTMLAIQRKNPQAFINNNINLLKEGQVLRIPDISEITDTGRQQAVELVAVQNNAWMGGASLPADSGPQLEGSKSYSTYESESSGAEGRVSLSSPEDVSGSSQGRGTGVGGSTEALQNELAITLEQLDKTNRENSDLQSKVASLEEQIQTLERMIALNNEDMRALELAAKQREEQEALAEVEKQATLETDDAAESEMAGRTKDPLSMGLDEADLATETAPEVDDLYSNTSDEDVSESVVEEPATDTTVAETAPVEEKPEAAPDRNKVVISAPKKESGILDLILDNILYIGLLVVAILGAAFYFLKQRSSEEDDFEEDFLEQTPLFEEQEVETAPEEDFEPVEEAAAAEEESVEREDDTAAEPETGDVVAEADIYIAYGKYDQAEDMLLKGLEREPENTDIRLKLLEVYANQQDAESFDPQFAKLYAIGNQGAISRAHQLRETISGAGEFDESLFDVSDAKSDDELDVSDSGEDEIDFEAELESLSLDSDEDDEISLELDLGSSQPAEEDDLSFDLETSLESTDESDVDLGDDLDLNFDTETNLEDELGELDLDFDSVEKPESKDDEDDFSIDFESPEMPSSEEAEDELSIDFDLEEGLDELGETDLSALDSELELELPEESQNDEAEEEFDLGDLDLGDDLSLEDESSDEEAEDDLSDLSIDFDIEEPEAEVAEPESLESDLAALDVALDGSFDLEETAEDIAESEDEISLDLEDELELESTESEPEPISSWSEKETLISPAINLEVESSKEDDLDIAADDMDLSALDEELDALTSDIDSDLADLDDELSFDVEPAPEAPPTATVMEEPEVDFDLEDDLDEPRETESVEFDESDLEMGEDTMFQEAIAEVPDSDLDFEIPEVDPEAAGDDEDLGFLSDSDEVATKLDLARAYIDMDDTEGARDIIEEIMKEGNDQQKQEAKNLIARLEG